MRAISKIVVHCTDSDVKAHDRNLMEVLNKWHVQERGFSDIGYHFAIDKSGKLYFCRDIERPGAHVKGHNSYSIGICLSGKENFTKKQKRTLYKLLRFLQVVFHLDVNDIVGHYELDSNKTCPNLDMNFIRSKVWT